MNASRIIHLVGGRSNLTNRQTDRQTAVKTLPAPRKH